MGCWDGDGDFVCDSTNLHGLATIVIGVLYLILNFWYLYMVDNGGCMTFVLLLFYVMGCIAMVVEFSWIWSS